MKISWSQICLNLEYFKYWNESTLRYKMRKSYTILKCEECFKMEIWSEIWICWNIIKIIWFEECELLFEIYSNKVYVEIHSSINVSS